MTSDGSVTRWLDPLRAGDPAAVQQLWERYFHRLVGLSRAKLQNAPRRAADEEDVALSAFDSFCRKAGQGRFPDLLDRESLWRLLMVITARKAAHLKRAETRKKRGGGAAPVTDSDRDRDDDSSLEQLLSAEPSPETAAEMAEEYRRLLQNLNDPELEAVAVARMEGYSVDEMARKFDYAPRSIKRKLQAIRNIWNGEPSDESD